MSLINDQVWQLREQSKNLWGADIQEIKALLVKAADTIEELSAKLAAANAERSIAHYNGGWIPVTERMPENETEVEISCIRRYIGAGDKKKECHLTARAFYTDGTMTTEDSGFAWKDSDDWEYDEEKDAHIIPEGWWECVTFSEEFGVVDAEVVAWRSLSEAYRGENKNG